MGFQLLAPDGGGQSVPKLAWGIRDFCLSYGVSKDTVHRAAKAGTLRTIRFGARILIPADEVARVSREGLQIRRGRPPKAKAPVGGNSNGVAGNGGTTGATAE